MSSYWPSAPSCIGRPVSTATQAGRETSTTNTSICVRRASGRRSINISRSARGVCGRSSHSGCVDYSERRLLEPTEVDKRSGRKGGSGDGAGDPTTIARGRGTRCSRRTRRGCAPVRITVARNRRSPERLGRMPRDARRGPQRPCTRRGPRSRGPVLGAPRNRNDLDPPEPVSARGSPREASKQTSHARGKRSPEMQRWRRKRGPCHSRPKRC